MEFHRATGGMTNCYSGQRSSSKSLPFSLSPNDSRPVCWTRDEFGDESQENLDRLPFAEIVFFVDDVPQIFENYPEGTACNIVHIDAAV